MSIQVRIVWPLMVDLPTDHGVQPGCRPIEWPAQKQVYGPSLTRTRTGLTFWHEPLNSTPQSLVSLQTPTRNISPILGENVTCARGNRLESSWETRENKNQSPQSPRLHVSSWYGIHIASLAHKPMHLIHWTHLILIKVSIFQMHLILINVSIFQMHLILINVSIFQMHLILIKVSIFQMHLILINVSIFQMHLILIKVSIFQMHLILINVSIFQMHLILIKVSIFQMHLILINVSIFQMHLILIKVSIFQMHLILINVSIFKCI